MDKTKINPEALRLASQIRSGAWLIPIRKKVYQLRWVIVSTLLVVSLLMAIIFGASLYRAEPKYYPPSLDVVPSQVITKQSSIFDSLKKEIQEFSPLLPDPVIPVFDNNLNLESL